MTSVTTESEALLVEARNATSGRAARTIVGGSGHLLRQTLIALVEGAHLADHENPGEATVHVLLGSVELSAGDSTERGEQGEILIVPDARHGLRALADCVVLLTVSKRA